MKRTERLFNGIAAIIARANETYPAAALQRVQAAFLGYLGAGEPVPRAEGQGAKFILPGLEAKWWWPREALGAQRAALEGAFPQIRDEVLRVLSGSATEPYFEKDLVEKGKWDALIIKRADAHPNETSCPRTTEVVKGLDGLGHEAFFSLLAPGTEIKPHVGGWNCRLTLHLALVIPPDCGIRVGGETRSWVEGETMIFDDSFDHEAWNRSSSDRAVLIVDFWHPGLSEVEIAVLREVNAVFAAESIAQQEAPA